MPLAPINNGHLYYEESGSGELIVLLPGLGHDHGYFATTLPLIAAAGCVVTPDPRGLGQSSPAQSYSVEQWAADLLELISHFIAARAFGGLFARRLRMPASGARSTGPRCLAHAGGGFFRTRSAAGDELSHAP